MFDGMAQVFYSPWLALIHATDVGNVHSCKSIRSLVYEIACFLYFYFDFI